MSLDLSIPLDVVEKFIYFVVDKLVHVMVNNHLTCTMRKNIPVEQFGNISKRPVIVR